MSKIAFLATSVLTALSGAAYYLHQYKLEQDRLNEERMI